MAICVLRGSIWYVAQPPIKKTIHLDTARMGRVVLRVVVNIKEDKNIHFFLLLENEKHFPVCPTTPLTLKSPQLTFNDSAIHACAFLL